MKNSLWIIIALVTGIVGFLVGYSVSGFTGSRSAQVAAQGAPAPRDGPPAAGSGGAPAQKAAAGGYGAGAPHGAAAGGYGGAGGTAHGSAAGGYGAAQPAQAQPEKVASEKPKAAGY